MGFILGVITGPFKFVFWLLVAVLLATGSLSAAASIGGTAARVGGQALGVTVGLVPVAATNFRTGAEAVTDTGDTPWGTPAPDPSTAP